MSTAPLSSPLHVYKLEIVSNEVYERKNDFIKQFKFSPDGQRVLASTESNDIISWGLNKSLINDKKYYLSSADDETNLLGFKNENENDTEDRNSSNNDNTDNSDSNNKALSPSTLNSCGESIYDYEWYPFMNENEPSSCCFITTCRDHPIHLWDANNDNIEPTSNMGLSKTNKNIRCSYSCYNAMDELEAANSVTFNLSGDKIYAGSNRMIRIFDVSQPGRTCSTHPTCKSRKDMDGQRGIISVLKFNPDYSGAYNEYLMFLYQA
jgi:hypothetical protein